MTTAAFIYDDSFSQYFQQTDHVLRPTRLRLTYELLAAYGAFSEGRGRLVKPRLANEDELALYHTREYIAAVKAFSRGDITSYDPIAYNFSEEGDNPLFPGIYEASARAAGASLVAAELVTKEKAPIAFNIAGGLHHAWPSSASGFCVFNDPAVAIARMLADGLRVAYVDIDAHHGDGVQNAFYATDQVLTISLHESGRYLFPGTGDFTEMGTGAGLGFSVNAPLAPGTGDDTYLWAFRELAPPLLQAFKPDVLVTQLGVDGHFRDPLAHLRLTTDAYAEVFRWYKSCGLPWVALGGGGYDIAVVARCWTLAYGIMIDKDWPDEIPDSFRERYGVALLGDREKPAEAQHDTARRFAEASVAAIKQRIFPHHGLSRL
ncbi:MAG: acetoin utilization protein AcuC [Chloroflexi bacterium]|nr:acetoin utilization protein AcuC [Chloroflexota bacterium]